MRGLLLFLTARPPLLRGMTNKSLEGLGIGGAAVLMGGIMHWRPSTSHVLKVQHALALMEFLPECHFISTGRHWAGERAPWLLALPLAPHWSC